MSTMYRRQRQQYLFVAIVTAIGIVSLLFYLILYRPARSESFRLQESITQLKRDIETRRQSVARLERLNAQLETFQQDRTQLLAGHFIHREVGWSEILPEIDRLAQAAGVRKTRVSYAIADSPQYGLYSVKIAIPVQGAYSNIVNFIKDLENSDTFFILESVDVRGGGSANSPGGTEISLNLNLETFFYQ